jgi:hypothetical protein
MRYVTWIRDSMRYSVPQLERMLAALDAEIAQHRGGLMSMRRNKRIEPAIDLTRKIEILNDAQNERREVAAALRMKRG